MRRGKWIITVACGLLVLSAIYSAISRKKQQADNDLPIVSHDIHEHQFSPRQRPLSGINPARAYSNAIADAVEKVMCSVVVIQTERKERSVQAILPGWERVVSEDVSVEGSGVIIAESGYILTSWHVIDGADSVTIILNDGTEVIATEIGHDDATDLAVLKLNDNQVLCPPIEFGDSDRVRVGDVAIAIGTPFSLKSSVTVGHVSQKGRRVQILPYEDFIQTDAAINQGNSGGPLIDVDGRLIGINTAVKTVAEQRGVGIAFAIPSNLAMRIAISLIERRKHEWPWIGGIFQKIDPRYADFFEGAHVVLANIYKDTPASRAKLPAGTPVFAIDGRPINDEFDAKRIIYNKSVGDVVVLTVLLDGTVQDIELELEEFPGMTF